MLPLCEDGGDLSSPLSLRSSLHLTAQGSEHVYVCVCLGLLAQWVIRGVMRGVYPDGNVSVWCRQMPPLISTCVLCVACFCIEAMPMTYGSRQTELGSAVFAHRLSLCEKALAEYLDTKRLAFPRFYFLSSSDLLDILSKGTAPQQVSQGNAYRTPIGTEEPQQGRFGFPICLLPS